MRTLPTILLLITALLGAASADGLDRVIAMPGGSTDEIILPQSVQKLLDERAAGPVTRISFFVHNVVTGDNKTVYDVASSEITSNSSTSFGLVQVVDNLVTYGPELDSQQLGRAQGTLAYSDLRETALSVNLNFIFTHGFYSGSTLTIQGRRPLSQPQQTQLSIVGGTGVFSLAQGIAGLTTFSNDPATSYTVIQYALFVYPAVGPPRA